MSWFDDTYGAKCVPALMRHLGDPESGTYTPDGGSPVVCDGIVTNIGKLAEADENGERLRIELEWIISIDPTSDYNGVADPETTAKVDLAGVNYSVVGVEAISKSLTKLRLVRLPVKRRSRERFRRQ